METDVSSDRIGEIASELREGNVVTMLCDSARGGGVVVGGAAPKPQPSPAQSPEQKPSPRAIPGMNEQRAEQILNSMEKEEQDVQGKQQRKNVPKPPPAGKDW